ncbi:SRPBCC family protein [Nocardia stercoris]|uniref:Transcriptional regulator n=1 Tax=Nocardia stercoris TaxID=2483361 RepID=A0A3M2LBD5_9NOCA|nr:SRPBCC family protein [Nocardia stercoris]RMI34862.1 transcriptional regulator [Nocardia stercoris]
MTDSSSFVVERSVTIAAPESRIRPLVENFHSWRDWSPWEDLDPAMQRTYSGPDSGVGARYAWEGNRKAGAGAMTITGTEPGRVDIDLNFRKPFKADNKVEFRFTPADSGTTVSWSMSGRKNLLMRVLAPIFDTDKVVGKDYERGLAGLKRLAEQVN